MEGFTDRPATKIGDDIFDIERYISGLGSFILECDTPMTIAIQGDWGSGKTSMMNMIRESLGGNVVSVWFNTWQYSQFNMSNDLAISLMTSLIEAFDIKDEKSKGIKKTLQIIGYVMKKTAIIAADTFIGGKVADGIENSLNKVSGNQDDFSMAKAISQIKEQFQECVNTSLSEHKKKRIVIFVDDIDRLQPSKAVELLEVFKLFLDCDNCVYVLAIDYEVVSQGVKRKYGSTIGEEKGRSFFDKIIQVPFKMPVAQYNVSKYVTQMLAKMKMGCAEDEVEDYIGLIQSSIGCNPRGMKRLFNAFILLNKVAPVEALKDTWNKKVLFAVLCLQLSFENVYNYIVRNRRSLSEDFLIALADKDRFEKHQDFDLLKKEFSIDDNNELNRVMSFMKNFIKIIDRDGNKEFSKEEIAAFVKALSFSTITSATDSKVTSVSDNEEIWRYRRLNRQIVKNVNIRLYDKFKIEFAVYQSNDDKSNNWKFHYASGYKWFWKDGLPYCLDSVIVTDLEKKTIKPNN